MNWFWRLQLVVGRLCSNSRIWRRFERVVVVVVVIVSHLFSLLCRMSTGVYARIGVLAMMYFLTMRRTTYQQQAFLSAKEKIRGCETRRMRDETLDIRTCGTYVCVSALLAQLREPRRQATSLRLICSSVHLSVLYTSYGY